MKQFDGGSLSAEIKNNSDGLDIIAIEAVSGGGTQKKGTVVKSHLDCTKGCYFSIDAKSVSWVSRSPIRSRFTKKIMWDRGLTRSELGHA